MIHMKYQIGNRFATNTQSPQTVLAKNVGYWEILYGCKANKFSGMFAISKTWSHQLRPSVTTW